MRKTSLLAYYSLSDKRTTYAKIIKALRTMKDNKGNFEQISRVAGLEPSQVWKRLPELVRDKVIKNTGETSLTSSGRQAMVRKLNKKFAA